jgi:hypothetical protein
VGGLCNIAETATTGYFWAISEYHNLEQGCCDHVVVNILLLSLAAPFLHPHKAYSRPSLVSPVCSLSLLLTVQI